MIKLAERELMTPLDQEARRLCLGAHSASRRHCGEPARAVDVLFVFVARCG
jgi:putative membrane protein